MSRGKSYGHVTHSDYSLEALGLAFLASAILFFLQSEVRRQSGAKHKQTLKNKTV